MQHDSPYFQAALTTNLSIERVTYPFEDLSDLYYQTQYGIGGLAESSNEGVFKVRKLALEQLGIYKLPIWGISIPIHSVIVSLEGENPVP